MAPSHGGGVLHAASILRVLSFLGAYDATFLPAAMGARQGVSKNRTRRTRKLKLVGWFERHNGLFLFRRHD